MSSRHARRLNSQGCRALPFLIRILLHRPQIVFGVLEVILRRDPVPAQRFGAGEGQIALVTSLRVLKVPHAGQPGRFRSRGLRSSRHCVGHPFCVWAWLRRRWFRFRNVFHVGPCVAPAKPCDVYWRNCRLQLIDGRCRNGNENFDSSAENGARHSIEHKERRPNGSRSTTIM